MKEIEVVQHSQVRGVRLFLDTVEYRTPHLHRDGELGWVLDGQMEIDSAQRVCLAREGDLFFYNSKQTHSMRQVGRACTSVYIQISPDFFAYSFPAIRGLHFDRQLLPAPEPEITDLLRTITLAYLAQEDGYELFCAGQIHLLLYRLLRCLPHHILTENEALEQDRIGERLDRLIDYVEQNHRSRLSLTEFARRENRSVSYLSHFVRENLGQSFQEYVNAVRFQTACSLLAGGQMRLLDVCMASGFSDYRYFSQTFRRRVGMTPEEYRRSHAARAGMPAFAAPHGGGHTLERIYTREESLAILRQLWQCQ